MIASMEILLATNNSHKYREFQDIFPGRSIILPKKLGIAFSHEETGKSFLENALGKARTLYSLSGRTSLADDSGLVVPALGGEPGIYSARYGNEGFNAEQRNSYLLSAMKDKKDRRAFFTCCLVMLFDEYRHITVQETVEGEILFHPRGAHGFGYDPVFYVPSFRKSMAELSSEEKHSISHRGKAGRMLRAILEQIDLTGEHNG